MYDDRIHLGAQSGSFNPGPHTGSQLRRGIVLAVGAAGNNAGESYRAEYESRWASSHAESPAAPRIRV